MRPMLTLVPNFCAITRAMRLPMYSCTIGRLDVSRNKRYSPKRVHTTMVDMRFIIFKTGS